MANRYSDPVEIKRTYRVQLTGETYPLKDEAKENGYRWAGYEGGWIGNYSDHDEAESDRQAWIADYEGINASLEIHETRVCRVAPPTWDQLVALRQRPVRWHVEALAPHLREVGVQIPKTLTEGTVKTAYYYRHTWLDEDLRERRIDGQPDEVTDLASYLAFADAPAYRAGRTGETAAEIAEQLLRTQQEIDRLRKRANGLVQIHKRLKAKLKAAIEDEASQHEPVSTVATEDVLDDLVEQVS